MAQRCGDALGVENGHLPLYQARIAQPLDPAQAGGRRGKHPLGQGLVAQAGIQLQLLQQEDIGCIECYLFH